MKKALIILALILLIPFQSIAGNIVHKMNGETHYITQVITLTDNATSVDLDDNICGGFLYQVEIKSTLDDAVTLTINSRLGTQLYTVTTSTATSGTVAILEDLFILNKDSTNEDNDYPTYTLANLGSGSITIEITVIK